MKTVNIGIIGGGLMGREMASAFARWCAFTDLNVRPQLVAVADLNPDTVAWFEQIPSCRQRVTDYAELLANPEVDVVYVAVPHMLHEKIYLDVLAAGKDLLAEKPFGIDLAAARRIAAAAESSGRFVRCSSEMPFFPGAQRALQAARSGKLGRVLEVVSGFHHSSDLDPDKAANWKRRSETCGEVGVLGDLGMHACHLPLRLGWKPTRLFAQLQKGYPERPDGRGGRAACDTWDNALLNSWVNIDGHETPLRFEMKRLAPGATNSWFIEILGTDGGVRFTTAEPKTLWSFSRDKEQWWSRTELGFSTPFKTVTGGIFEPGFPDVIQQMWAAYLAERDGSLGARFGCATPAEAIASHEIFAAALTSHANQSVQCL
ncbi:Gfo/Idh/MocA family protein [Synoicihabitans lomoniglobus]|uniref:Gfo/Idh/MocA family oxidoreductase n=1 Tax=Synoicihabitans lomoniglobus TaxID=2909285 RepID=A0AAF0CHA9_9BACT|nr:Gfo/Idh/MocA family oxidoreductase [Opitutaceae bacterium LMO-M01]WED64082.1 Gfo/Idh/MocA family oxidoreductase [Opitutaceae bacterium LMO-M01]